MATRDPGRTRRDPTPRRRARPGASKAAAALVATVAALGATGVGAWKAARLVAGGRSSPTPVSDATPGLYAKLRQASICGTPNPDQFDFAQPTDADRGAPGQTDLINCDDGSNGPVIVSVFANGASAAAYQPSKAFTDVRGRVWVAEVTSADTAVQVARTLGGRRVRGQGVRTSEGGSSAYG